MNLLGHILRRNVFNVAYRNLTERFTSVRSYHVLFKTMNNSEFTNLNKNVQSSLLTPVTVISIPICGFKFKDEVRRRCKDCYIVVKDRQKIVLCKTHPRHKQKQIMPKEKDTWVITHRTAGRIRPW